MSVCPSENSTEDLVVEQYAPLVFSQAKRFCPTNISQFEDYLQAGYIGLIKASRHFDENRGVKFSTFAVVCIRKEMLKEAQKFKDGKRAYEDCNDAYTLDGQSLWEFLPDNLTDVERNAVMLRMKKYTYMEIGQQMNFTKSWASEVIASAFKKIKEANL